MNLPDGLTWNRSWYSLARLMRDGDVIGEVQLHNGTWYGTYGGKPVIHSPWPDTVGAQQTVMEQVAEIAVRAM